MYASRCQVILYCCVTSISVIGCTDATNSPEDNVTAILRVNRHVQPDLATEDFHIYRETMAQLIKSDFVINAAWRLNDISKLKGLSPGSLKNAIHVDLLEGSELVSVKMQIGRWKAEEAERILNAVINGFQSEVVNKERLEAIDTLTKLRKRYQVLFESIRKKSDEISALDRQLGATSNLQTDFKLAQIIKKLDLCEASLLELQLEEIALEHTKDQAALTINKKQQEMLKKMVSDLTETASNFGKTSGELEARTDDLTALRRDMQTVRTEMQKLEIELDGPRRISVIQFATVGK